MSVDRPKTKTPSSTTATRKQAVCKDLRLRLVGPEDSEEIKRWWIAHGHHAFDLEELPPVGALAERKSDKLPLAAVWLFYTNSKFAFLDWGVTNPDAPLRVRAYGLIAGYEELKRIALEQGYTYVWAFSSSRGLSRNLITLGFKKNPIGQDSLVYSTKGVE